MKILFVLLMCFAPSAFSSTAQNYLSSESTHDKTASSETADKVAGSLSFKTTDFQHENLSFDFISSDGSYWYDCKHNKEEQPHSWTVYCDRYVFKLHLMLRQYNRENETTYEFHYWADETEVLHETHTQSTWLTVDKNAKPKNVIGYLGFTQDASQLRIEIKP